MNLSVSSIFITLIISSVMITLFYLILFNKKLIFLLRTDLPIVLSFMIVLRLLFPVEWKFTITFAFPWIMNPLQSFLNYTIFDHFSILSLLLMIWLMGIIVQTFRFFVQFKKIESVFNVLDRTSIKKKVSDYLEIDARFDYPVWIADSIPFPMILGFKKIILIPKINLEKEQTKHIILHEIEHLKHKDNFIKLFLNILLIIYWWFPPVYWLCNKIQLVLEMRVDKKVTQDLSELGVTKYAETLVKVQKALLSKTETTFSQLGISSTFYINDGTSTLYYRIEYLFNQNYKKSTNALLILIILSLPLISNSIVLEPFHKAPFNENNYFHNSELESSYIIHHKNGTYTLYFNDETFELTEIDPIFKDLPIIEE